MWTDSGMHTLRTEVLKASPQEARAYLLGASRDGTFNRLHNTLRISQSDVRWLNLLQCLFARVGSRSWVYREGTRDVWVVETTCRLDAPEELLASEEQVAFARGYFDAEGGVPRQLGVRFYVQFTQKRREDLEQLRAILMGLAIRCGRIHNPSARVDPNYWRFYVLAGSHDIFVRRIGSWHPRKRPLLDARVEGHRTGRASQVGVQA